MKYSEKKNRKAFLRWEIEERLNPEAIMSSKEVLEINADTMAELKTNELLKYIKK